MSYPAWDSKSNSSKLLTATKTEAYRYSQKTGLVDPDSTAVYVWHPKSQMEAVVEQSGVVWLSPEWDDVITKFLESQYQGEGEFTPKAGVGGWTAVAEPKD